MYGLSERDLQHNVALGGDNVLLATLIDICRRRAIHSDKFVLVMLLGELAEFDICHTLPGPQHDLCALWNELVEEAGNRGSYSIRILHEIRQLYILLHEGTDAAPTAFSASTDRFDPILKRPSSYPLCNIASHRTNMTAHVHSPTVPLLTRHVDSPDALLHRSHSGNSTVSRQVKQTNIASPFLPSDPTTPSEVGDAPTATELALLAHTNSDPLDASPSGGEAAALQDAYTSPAAMLSHTPEIEVTTQRNIVATSVSSGFNPLLPSSSVTSVPTPALVDATVRFLEEFTFKEKKPPRMHRPLQQAREMPREDEEEKNELNAVNSFELTYLYDAIKEKKQLKDILVRCRDHDAHCITNCADLLCKWQEERGCCRVFRTLPGRAR